GGDPAEMVPPRDRVPGVLRGDSGHLNPDDVPLPTGGREPGQVIRPEPVEQHGGAHQYSPGRFRAYRNTTPRNTRLKISPGRKSAVWWVRARMPTVSVSI